MLASVEFTAADRAVLLTSLPPHCPSPSTPPRPLGAILALNQHHFLMLHSLTHLQEDSVRDKNCFWRRYLEGFFLSLVVVGEAPKITTVSMSRWPPLKHPLAPGYHEPRPEPGLGTTSRPSLVMALLFLPQAEYLPCSMSFAAYHSSQKSITFIPKCPVYSSLGWMSIMCTRGRKMESKELPGRNWNKDDSPPTHTQFFSHFPAGTDHGLHPAAHQVSDTSPLSPAPRRKKVPTVHGCSLVSGARVSTKH